MAGRFVVVEFDDREDAEAFVRGVEKGHIDGRRIHQARGSVRLLAEFMRPDKFCECPDKRRQNVSNWAKGSRTGLYLCKVCKLPSVHHQRGIMDRLKYVFGNNLLERG